MTSLDPAFLATVTGGAFRVVESGGTATAAETRPTPSVPRRDALDVAAQCMQLDGAAREAAGPARRHLRRAADACWAGARSLSR